MVVNKQVNAMKNFCSKKKESCDYCSKISLNDIQSSMTVLIGPNGTGKSRSITNIEYECNKNKIDFLKFSRSNNDIVTNSNFNPYRLVSAFRSEGERICDSLVAWLGDYFKYYKGKELYIAFDEIDSGLSIDKLYETISFLRELLYDLSSKKVNVHAIFTSNSYEMCSLLNDVNIDTIWVPTKQHIKITSYESFKNMYMLYYNEMRSEEDE